MWKCPRCKREFLKFKQLHSCVIFPIENHFKGKEQIGKILFEALVKNIETNIGPLKIESLPCCIHLLSDYAFSGVWIGSDKIKIDFRLDKKIIDKRILKCEKISNSRYMHYLEIHDKNEIDDKLLGWIKSAYDLSKNK